jgi:hypothetical protein
MKLNLIFGKIKNMKTMNKLLLAIALTSVIFLTGIVSCKKETIVQNTTTDTVYVNLFTPMTTTILTANKWTYQEIRGVRGANNYYYLRGGLNNSEALEDEFIEFHTDGTANYHAQSGFERTITWEFNNDNSKITLHFTNTPANFDVFWDNMRVKDNKWYFDEYYTDGNLGFNAHSQNIRIPKP